MGAHIVIWRTSACMRACLVVCAFQWLHACAGNTHVHMHACISVVTVHGGHAHARQHQSTVGCALPLSQSLHGLHVSRHACCGHAHSHSHSYTYKCSPQLECSLQMCQHTESDCYGNLLFFHSWSRQATRHRKDSDKSDQLRTQVHLRTLISQTLKDHNINWERGPSLETSAAHGHCLKTERVTHVKSLMTFTSSCAKTRHPNAQVLKKSTCAMHCHSVRAHGRAIPQFLRRRRLNLFTGHHLCSSTKYWSKKYWSKILL
jgi:hypothetical protein